MEKLLKLLYISFSLVINFSIIFKIFVEVERIYLIYYFLF